MFVTKSVRITPALVGAAASRIYGPSTVAGVEQCRRNVMLTNSIFPRGGVSDYLLAKNNFISFKSAIAPIALTSVRYYAEDAKREQRTTSATTSSAPSAPAILPDREQVERFLFRVLALIWDISVWAYINTKHVIQNHIIANDSVQFYWKRMHERMAKAKKEW